MPTNLIASLLVSATLLIACTSTVMLLPNMNAAPSDTVITFNWR